jgi:hypothetical protein
VEFSFSFGLAKDRRFDEHSTGPLVRRLQTRPPKPGSTARVARHFSATEVFRCTAISSGEPGTLGDSDRVVKGGVGLDGGQRWPTSKLCHGRSASVGRHRVQSANHRNPAPPRLPLLPKVTVESGPYADLEPNVVATSAPSSPLIGRDQELSSLDRLMASAVGGKRQIVFIAGSAGIGKTALLQAFLRNMTAAGDARIACGHCVEQFGTREAYLPIFDAVSRLCDDERASEALTVLAQYAPSWLAQMPGLLSEDQFQTLQKKVQGITQARMLGELCEALEAMAADQLLVLGLEDLHWMDLATLDLLSIVARREHRARLMVIGTYRPADVIVSNHPLRAVLSGLQAHRQCTVLLPENLTEDDVHMYLSYRFPAHEFPPKLKQLIHRNTAGNPLFVTAIVDGPRPLFHVTC